MNLAGRTVLLTGATGGLGHAIARRLRAAGAELVLTGRRTEVLEPLAAETGARSLAVDLADAAAVRAPRERVRRRRRARRPTRGCRASGQLTSFSVEEIDRALAVNLRAPMVLARVHRRAHGRARAAATWSSCPRWPGKVGTPRSSVYSATKFGLRGFAQSLREDLRPSGVGVSAIFPGFVRDAGMFHDTGTKLPPGVGTVSPEDVADAVVRAIERNRGEIDVAPVGLRAGADGGRRWPPTSRRTGQRKLGGQRIAEQHVSAPDDQALAVSPEQVGPLVEAGDRGLVAEGCVSSAMVVVSRASRQGLRCVLAGAVDRAVGPAAEHGADEALGLAVGLRPVGAGAQVADARARGRRSRGRWSGRREPLSVITRSTVMPWRR